MNKVHWEIFQDPLLYEFRLISSNGKVLLQSIGGYASVETARNALTVVTNLIPHAEVKLIK